MKPELDQYGRNFGYTSLLYSTEYNGWTEAYGMLGSYRLSFKAAMGEIRWLVASYPEKYIHWAVERIVLEDGERVRDPRTMVIAQSKDAPIWTCAEDREPYSDGTFGYNDLNIRNRVG